MSWNNRVIECDQSSPNESWFEVREVLYDDAGAIMGVAESAASVVGNNLDDLRGTYRMLASAFDKPVLRFGLTPAEAAIALALTQGMSVAEIAAVRHVTRDSCRWHIKQILSKTGTTSQARAIRLMLTAVP